jgi:hypothetical protein
MLWLKRALRNWVNNDSININKASMSEDSPRRKEYDEISTNETIRFNLTPAVGGRILRVIRESNQKNISTLGSQDSLQIYVIPSGEDVGSRVSKIINMELMK